MKLCFITSRRSPSKVVKLSRVSRSAVTGPTATTLAWRVCRALSQVYDCRALSPKNSPAFMRIRSPSSLALCTTTSPLLRRKSASAGSPIETTYSPVLG